MNGRSWRALEVLLVGAGGLALYGFATVAGYRGPVIAAALEETGKALLLLGAGAMGVRATRGAAPMERSEARRRRAARLGLARGLSLGLASIGCFACLEHLAYAIAFPEAGILDRLLWVMPVHLGSALVQALGTLLLVRSFLAPGTWRARTLRGFLPWLLGFALALAWHGGANLLVTGLPSPRLLLLGGLAGWGIASFLLLRFLRHAYLGGLLHGLD
jgi:hypothetical protein